MKTEFELAVEAVKAVEAELRPIQEKLGNAYTALRKTDDGHLYAVSIYCYGSHKSYACKNIYEVWSEADYYYGDNGICYVMTTNPDYKDRDGRSRQLPLITKEEVKAFQEKHSLDENDALLKMIDIAISKSYEAEDDSSGDRVEEYNEMNQEPPV